jgi:hypothetical protein
LGLPDADQMLVGRHVLTWTGGHTTIDVDGDSGTAKQWYCSVRMIVDSQSIISDVEIKENSAYVCPRVRDNSGG